MEFDLTTLMDWVRRTASDNAVGLNDTITANGGTTYTINDDGDITLTSIVVDSEPVDLGDVTLQGNQIIFDVPIPEGANIEVGYTRRQYDDNELIGLICDAAVEVGVDLNINWMVNLDQKKILYINEAEFITPDGSTAPQLNPLITRLIVLKTDLTISGDKANRAADDAILIKDGDTTIDTSRGSGAKSGSMTTKKTNYELALTRARQRRFKGAHIP